MKISSGIDIIEIATVKTLIDRHGERFLKRAFTEKEVAYCSDKKDQYPHYAGRIAAKEAVFKALKTGWNLGVQWNQIEVLNDEQGAPQLTFSGQAAQYLHQSGFANYEVSISHAGNMATAVVILYHE